MAKNYQWTGTLQDWGSIDYDTNEQQKTFIPSAADQAYIAQQLGYQGTPGQISQWLANAGQPGGADYTRLLQVINPVLREKGLHTGNVLSSWAELIKPVTSLRNPNQIFEGRFEDYGPIDYDTNERQKRFLASSNDALWLARQAGYTGPAEYAVSFLMGARSKDGKVYSADEMLHGYASAEQARVRQVLGHHLGNANIGFLDGDDLSKIDPEAHAQMQRAGQIRAWQNSSGFSSYLGDIAPFIASAGLLGPMVSSALATGAASSATGAGTSGGFLGGAGGGGSLATEAALAGGASGATQVGATGGGLLTGAGGAALPAAGAAAAPTALTAGEFSLANGATGVGIGNQTAGLGLQIAPTTAAQAAADPFSLASGATQLGINGAASTVGASGGLLQKIANLIPPEVKKVLGSQGFEKLVGGIISAIGANQQQDKLEQLANQTDPFSDQRALYQNELRRLWTDPNYLKNNAGFLAGLQAVNRRSAKLGQMFSGNNLQDVVDYAMGKQIELSNALLEPAGARIGPEAASRISQQAIATDRSKWGSIAVAGKGAWEILKEFGII